MRAVALISGGKDSCYNMMQCIAAGHTIVALANLQPSGKDELDSYMYQSVGHQGVGLYAEAMGLPLYRQQTQGVAKDTTRNYTPVHEDEVEDLYNLLARVKQEMDVEAVAVGAILSDYQRIRVENVCSRLGMVSLAYLWRRNQAELLQEMIQSGIEAIIIKTAALGLELRHLGLSLRAAQEHLRAMHDKYGLNMCGEGGEYETFTLDCPLFSKKLVVDEKELVVHSNDPVAPVGYLNLKLHLEDKPHSDDTLLSSVKNSLDFVSDLNDNVYSDMSDVELNESELETMEILENDGTHNDNPLTVTYVSDDEKRSISRSASIDAPLNEEFLMRKRLRTESGDLSLLSSSPTHEYEYDSERHSIADHGCIYGNTHGWYFVGGVVGAGVHCAEYAEDAMKKLSRLLSSEGLRLTDVCSVNLYVRDMSEYAHLNQIYSSYFSFPNPPTRVCVQCPLPPNVGLILDAVAHNVRHAEEGAEVSERSTMHVQGISHWAPANIGPYSQAVKVGEIIGTCGQIALVPGAMRLVEGGARRQCMLALRHVGRVLRAAHTRTHIRSVVQSVCYVTRGSSVAEARRQLERRTAGAIVEYAVVTALPRAAAVEWHCWAHTNNHRFDYEETGCNVGEYKVAICRRWNYENTVAAFVCYVATGSSPSTCQLSFASEEACSQHQALAAQMSSEELAEILEYSVKKLLNDCQLKGPEPAVNLRVFYQVTCAPPVSRLLASLAAVRARLCQRLTFTAVPVLMLHNAFTFLSISGMRMAE